MSALILESRLIDCVEIAVDLYKLSFHAPDIAHQISPGQFVLAHIGGTTDPFLSKLLLPRPEGDGVLTCYFHLQRAGDHEFLKQLNRGSIELLGPLGSSFNHEEASAESTVIFSDPSSLAAMEFLAEKLGLSEKSILPVSEVVEHHPHYTGNALFGAGNTATFDRIRKFVPESVGFQYLFSDTPIACGIGTCVACLKELSDGRFSRACREGLVYNATDFR